MPFLATREASNKSRLLSSATRQNRYRPVQEHAQSKQQECTSGNGRINPYSLLPHQRIATMDGVSHAPLLKRSLFLGLAVFSCVTLSCSNLNTNALNMGICNCIPLGPDVTDYRHVAKHVALPNQTPEEITVDTILSWPQDLLIPPDAPRSGRELQLFHLGSAFLQNASINSGDCDIHFEISATADKNSPRVVVETPIDSEYCPSRQNIQSQLAQLGFTLDAQHGGELPQAVRAEVLGLAFEDFEHNRGSAQVATVWELHPATLNVLP
jgi:hypothetical protein